MYSAIGFQVPPPFGGGGSAFVQAVRPILQNVGVGISMVVVENIFTGLHYGHPLLRPKTLLLEMLLGYYTYGSDRFYDALQSCPEDDPVEKKELYTAIRQNEHLQGVLLDGVFCGATVLLLPDEERGLFFLTLLYSTLFYPRLKQQFPLLKPFYVSAMWVIGCLLLPCVLEDKNWDILTFPLEYIPLFLIMTATSNQLDFRDQEEDARTGIQTLSRQLGQYSPFFSVMVMSLGILMMTTASHFADRPWVNAFFVCACGFTQSSLFLQNTSRSHSE